MSAKRNWERSRIARYFFILTKLTKLAKLAKLISVGKPLLMLGSLAVSGIAYTFWLGPWLAIGFVLMLLIHEMGHVVAMRMRGYMTGTPVFIPFLGAAIFAPKFKGRDDEAFVGVGGPFIGGAAGALAFGVWSLLPPDTNAAHILLVTSYLATFLNLFNMIPLRPLDGGRVLQAGGDWSVYLGIAILMAFSLWLREPVVLFIWILCLQDIRFLHRRVRAFFGVGLWITMVLLMTAGYSKQPWWLDSLDSMLCAVMVGMLILAAVSAKLSTETNEGMSELSYPDRVRWIGTYFLVGALLVLLLLLQAGPLAAIKGS
ncbi:MAG: hypothetical protein Q7R54_01555 [bacterium]|nr:hypothetical protein [bacterium]